MAENAERATVPWNWRLAGLLRRLPEFRGRDRVERLLLRDSAPPAGTHRVTVGPDLRFEVRYRDDGSCVDLFFLQYQAPSLAPVLEATLAAGGSMFDVGANLGIYSGWAARLVGPAGQVHAFEPVPATRTMLERFVAANRLSQVRVVPSAVGASPGTVTLHLVPRASGLASAVGPATPDAVPFQVPLTSLDAYVERTPDAAPPQLVKVDVEGFEFEVLRGARHLLAAERSPVVLFESQAEHLVRAGSPFPEIVRWLESELGYRAFALRPSGLVPLPPGTGGPRSLNTLALHPARHAALQARLSRVRFARNQSC